MRKVLLLLIIGLMSFTLTGCGLFGDGNGEDPYDYKNHLNDCDGHSDFVVIDGVCIPIDEMVSENIKINSTETITNFSDGIELMTDFVADLTDSKGLAVVPKSVMDSNINTDNNELPDLINLAASIEADTENIIVKLTTEGFFEQVSFTDDTGFSVEVTANPLALEVYGDFTVIVFEVSHNYDQHYTPDFTQKLWDSLYSGGIYLMHNETGKMFATKEVTYTENTWTYTEDHSRNVSIEVTIGQPVVEVYQEPIMDEFGNPVLDENGNQTYNEVSNPLLDADGNPIIISEGPIEMVTQEVQVMDYFEVEVLDDDGNPVLDENGDPTYEIVEEPKLDENGDPVYETMEVPVLDENGDPVYVQTFWMEFYIEDIREITMVENYAQITDNPLSQLAQRFIDKIMAEYWNWNYYRVNNYNLDWGGFAYTADYIYYLDNNFENNEQERVLKKLDFDPVAEELLIEDYLNVTKAGFDECQLMLDPFTETVICKPWDNNNIKIYSPTEGLKTIDDSKDLQPVTFPNGELYFFKHTEEFVEDLGYFTTALYQINPDGTLTANYIELAEKEQVCWGSCDNSFNANLVDNTTQEWGNEAWINIALTDGEKMMSGGDLTIKSVGTFDATRDDCTDANGCWYSVKIEILDENDDVLMELDRYGTYYPEDTPPPYVERYTLEGSSTVNRFEYSQVDSVCENAGGCAINANLVDRSINTVNGWGLWLNETIEYSETDVMPQHFEIPETNTGIYEYTKDVAGFECEFTTCDEWVEVFFYDIEGELITHTSAWITFDEGDIVPLHIDYHITANTEVTLEEGVCTTSTGCWRSFQTPENIWFSIQYEQGDEMIQSITFDATDRIDVVAETLTRESCEEVDGCYQRDVTYTIVDAETNPLYVFTTEWSVFVEYGDMAPYNVTIGIGGVNVTNKKESSQDPMICADEDGCREWVSFYMDDEYFGGENILFADGENVKERYNLVSTSLASTEANQLCYDLNGCIQYTTDFVIEDEAGNVLPEPDWDWYDNSTIPVFFAFGETLPKWDEFSVVYTLSNVEYYKYRMSIYDFIYMLDQVTVLDENLYLLERPSWQQGQDNFILEFNELTDRYSVKFTNISAVLEITSFGDGYVAIDEDKTGIINFVSDPTQSDENYYHFNVTNMTDGIEINEISDLIVDFDGSVYFVGIDNFIQDVTGYIDADGNVTLDTEVVEREVIRMRPIN